MRKTRTSSKARAKEPEPEPEVAAEVTADVEEQDGEATTAAGPTDNVGDISVEVNVEDLIAQIESESKGGPLPDGSARRRIEDILEEKRVAKEVMDLEDFDIED